MARPAKLNPETATIIVDAIKVGCPTRVACQAGGIGLTTFKSWMTRGISNDEADAPYRAFRADVKKSRAHGVAYALKIIQQAMPDHWQAAAWFLERSRPMQWGRIDRAAAHEASRLKEGLADVSKMSDAELEAIARG